MSVCNFFRRCIHKTYRNLQVQYDVVVDRNLSSAKLEYIYHT